MRVVVTGANGYIGSRLVNSLSQQGHEVFAVDLSFEQCHVEKRENVHLITTPIEQLNSDSFGGGVTPFTILLGLGSMAPLEAT